MFPDDPEVPDELELDDEPEVPVLLVVLEVPELDELLDEPELVDVLVEFDVVFFTGVTLVVMTAAYPAFIKSDTNKALQIYIYFLNYFYKFNYLLLTIK